MVKYDCEWVLPRDVAELLSAVEEEGVSVESLSASSTGVSGGWYTMTDEYGLLARGMAEGRAIRHHKHEQQR